MPTNNPHNITDEDVVKALRLITAKINFYKNIYKNRSSPIDWDEITSYGNLAIAVAFEGYDPSFGASFPTHAMNVFKHGMARKAMKKMATRKYNKEAESIISKQISRDPNPVDSAIARIEQPRTKTYEALKGAINKLTDENKNVVCQILDGVPMTRIAKAQGCKKQAISHRWKRARLLMRESLLRSFSQFEPEVQERICEWVGVPYHCVANLQLDDQIDAEDSNKAPTTSASKCRKPLGKASFLAGSIRATLTAA